MTNRLLVLLMILTFTACSPRSMQEYRNRGRLLCEKIASELGEIDSREELEKALPLLKKRFDELVTLSIQARTYELRHGGEEDTEDSYLSSSLKVELCRIYSLEGGKELIEKAEREALLKLDAFERRIATKGAAKHKVRRLP
jgi:hypothetical protein